VRSLAAPKLIPLERTNEHLRNIMSMASLQRANGMHKIALWNGIKSEGNFQIKGIER
jgi:hypothetical protein